MPVISEISERYKDYYCEELFASYLNSLIDLDEVLLKLDYNRIANQKELFNFLNLLLSDKFPHICYNEFCREKLYFSNTFETAKKDLNFTLKEFVKIWITPHNLGNFKVWDIKIPFFCCNCYQGKFKDKKSFLF